MMATKRDVPLQAILKLVEYLECDERKHWQMRCAAGEDASNHIFNAVKAVSDWLATQPGMTTADEREAERMQPIVDAFAAVGIRPAVDGDFADFWAGQGDYADKRY